jgi:site-specific recombinase XerD
MKTSNSLLALLDLYQTEMRDVAGFSPKTLQTYLSCLDQFMNYLKKNTATDLLSCPASHLRQWMGELKATRISNSRLGHHRCALSSFYGFIKRLGLRDDNPAESIFPFRKARSTRNQPPPAEKITQLLDAIETDCWEGLRDFLMISILWALGLRLSEMTHLKVENLRHIDKTGRTALLYVAGKGMKHRALFVVDRLFDYFMKYLQHPESPRRKGAYLFPGKNDGATNNSTIQRRIERYRQAAALTCRITPHVLRHSFATEMYKRGVPLQAIGDMLGHRSIEESAVYLHVNRQMQRQALLSLTLGGYRPWQ